MLYSDFFFSLTGVSTIMVEISLNPKNMSLPQIAGFLVAVVVACILNLVSSVAIYRTKKTPHATKLLSLGMLSNHFSFLILSACSKLIAFKDFGLIQHLTRGFNISAQCIVCSMAIERFLVIHKPYMYLQVSKQRTKLLCISVALISMLQYMLARGLGCYARGLYESCGFFMRIYFVIIPIVLVLVSYVCYGSIFRTVCRKETNSVKQMKQRLLLHNGTLASSMYLISTSFNTVAYLGLSLYKLKTSVDGKFTDINVLVDIVALVNCYIDPFIYIIWFSETRMELLKLFQLCCPRLQPKIEKMRIEIFNIQISSTKQS